MNCVWYDDDADVIWVSNRADPFPPRTLEAVVVDGEIRIRRKGQTVTVTGGRYDEIGDGAGNGFADMASAMAYLTSVFSRRRAAGEAYVVGIPITQAGQTRLPLDVPPTVLSTLRLEVNGVTYRAPEIAASDVAVDWLNPDFPLTPSDRVTVVYS